MTTLITNSSSLYTDTPAPLGKVVAEYRIDAASAIAYRVQTGQYIQIIDVEGAQCSDFLAFAGTNYSEELDSTVTRTLNALTMPQAGLHGKYFSQNMQPLVEVIQDTCGRHDSFLLACTDQYYESVKTLDQLRYFRFATGSVGGLPALVSRTGYTGELGYELFIHPNDGAALWKRLMAAGEPFGLLPMGMLALDRARIEAGLLSAGYEFDDLISPYQAGIGWSVVLKKPDFIGKAALEAIKAHPPKLAVGLVLEGNEVAQHGQCVYAAGERWRVGTVTSATFSPILNRSIAMAQIVPEYAQSGTEVEVGFVDGRVRRVRAVVGPLAAYDPSKSRVRG